MTVLWVLRHRLRGHWIVPDGWAIHRGASQRVWSCYTCYDKRHFTRESQREGWAPRWLGWQERG